MTQAPETTPEAIPDQLVAAYEALATWETDEWEEVRTSALRDFFAPSLNEWGDDLPGLFELVGEPATSLVMACAFDDFASSRFDPGNRNIVDAFLDAEGAGMDGRSRHFLEALRDSTIGLYEVVDTAPDGNLVLQDMMREGDRLNVAAATAALDLAPGDRLACRVLTTEEGRFVSPGLIPMPAQMAETMRHQIEQIVMRERRALLSRKNRPSHAQLTDSVLREASFMFANVWLLGIAEDSDEREPNGVDDPGDDIEDSDER